MRKINLLVSLLCLCRYVFTQQASEYVNSVFLKKLYDDKSYSELKTKIITAFGKMPAGQWGEFVPGVKEALLTTDKIIAFTFDACGGRNGNGYDRELIEYLQKEKIPATLFVSGKWIDSQFSVLNALSHDSLFEIENHGLNHRPCSADGKSAYGIHGTTDIQSAFDEIEANERKIEAITGCQPRYYRSATVFIDETCVKMASMLGLTTISYQVLAGDAIPFLPVGEIEKNVLKNIKPGAIVLMHFNHPEWNTFEAIQKIVPKLRERGYTFSLLRDFKLVSVRNH
jgi:peptidoglycan/xylan/chitin deacetylase (PgdA/CDA1 family)